MRKNLVLSTLLLTGITSTYASTTSNPISTIIESQLPAGAKPVVADSMEQDKVTIKLLSAKDKQDIFGGEPQFYPTGIMGNGSNIDIYEGSFSNSGQNEYLFLAWAGGSMSTDTIAGVFKKVGNNLIKVELDTVISKNLFKDPSGDLSRFYMWMARPIAYTQNGKTYLRFKNFAPNDNAVSLCTYLWSGDKFTLINQQGKNCIK